MKSLAAVVTTALSIGTAQADTVTLKKKVEDRLTQLKAKGYALTEIRCPTSTR